MFLYSTVSTLNPAKIRQSYHSINETTVKPYNKLKTGIFHITDFRYIPYTQDAPKRMAYYSEADYLSSTKATLQTMHSYVHIWEDTCLNKGQFIY